MPNEAPHPSVHLQTFLARNSHSMKSVSADPSSCSLDPLHLDSQEGLLQPLLIVTSFFPLSWHHLCLSRTAGSAKCSPAGRKMGIWVVLGSLEGKYFFQDWRAARRKKELTSLMGPIASFALRKTNQEAGSPEIMIPRKQEIRSPKFCSKSSCSPQQLLQKHPLRVNLSHMFARKPGMWHSCHPFLPVTADSSTNHPLHTLPFLLHTAHPLHTLFTSGLDH